MNPFLVLDVPLDASDADVRAAYQSLLRRFPPERRPERFQIIQEAYQTLRTERDRWNWRLLHLGGEHDGPLEALEDFARLPGRMRAPGAALFRSFLRSCAGAAKREQSAFTPHKR
jgi:curved DNA-binding protein CbpA